MRTDTGIPRSGLRATGHVTFLLVLVVFSALQPNMALSTGFGYGGYGLREEESRFLPGNYYFNKGCDAFARGKAADAIRLWQQAAGWGHKVAQYDLGIAYFKGQGIQVDRARGLAWLALASERNDEQFQESFHAAWYQVSDEERAEAQRIHAELKPVYADATALKKAARRYEDERRNITGSRVGSPGHVVIYAGGSSVGQDASQYLAAVEKAAESYFTTGTGSVIVGPLVPDDSSSLEGPARE